MVMETRGGPIHGSHDPHVKKGMHRVFCKELSVVLVAWKCEREVT